MKGIWVGITPRVLLEARHRDHKNNPKKRQHGIGNPCQQGRARGARTLCQDLEIEPDASLTLDDNGVAAAFSLGQGDCCAALLGTGPLLFSPSREGAPNESKDIARCGNEERSPLALKDPWEDGNYQLQQDNDEA